MGDPKGELDIFGLACDSYKKRAKQDAYALYDSEEALLAGEKAFYVGISNDAHVRLKGNLNNSLDKNR